MVALICLSFLLFSCQKDDNEKKVSAELCNYQPGN